MENFLAFFGMSVVILLFVYLPIKLRFQLLSKARLWERAIVDVFIMSMLAFGSAIILGNTLV